MSRPTGPQWVPWALFQGQSDYDVKLTTCLKLVPRARKRRSRNPLPHGFMVQCMISQTLGQFYVFTAFITSTNRTTFCVLFDSSGHVSTRSNRNRDQSSTMTHVQMAEAYIRHNACNMNDIRLCFRSRDDTGDLFVPRQRSNLNNDRSFQHLLLQPKFELMASVRFRISLTRHSTIRTALSPQANYTD
jgi:hypothetical protein